MPTIGPNGLTPASDDAPQAIFRDYTVRSFRPTENEIDIDIVLHGDGPAVTWAKQATVGQMLGVLGPRGSRIVSKDFAWYLLAGDETAIPAIERWVEELPAGVPVFAVIEVADAGEQQQFTTETNLTVTWLHRDGKPAGTTTLLETAIRTLDLPDEQGFAWVAGETDTLKPIRRYLRQELGMDNDRVDVDGYWRRGISNFDHHTPFED